MADFDPRTPSIARVYDYILGGKDNFAADREVAERLMAVAPLTVEVSRENRQFLARAVTWAASQGIGQFIDLGCGMPTVPNTHETAQAIIPAARVAYIDNDPVVVLTHLRALAEHGNPGVTVLDGDVREPGAIIAAIQDDIDLEAPACLLMGYLLHFFAPDAARELVASYVARLVPGSYVVLSVGRADGASGETGFRRLFLGRDAGLQPFGGRIRELLRPLETRPARRGRRPGVVSGLRAAGARRAPRRTGDRRRRPRVRQATAVLPGEWRARRPPRFR
jgi:hypothetical protein